MRRAEAAAKTCSPQLLLGLHIINCICSLIENMYVVFGILRVTFIVADVPKSTMWSSTILVIRY